MFRVIQINDGCMPIQFQAVGPSDFLDLTPLENT